ncbi:hypothetical protein [Gloeocapsa sp. PCC 73106]|uniref:hypothetical protein n=1 Tax=Gloeocapsa sp. PCC 73106 TaxID=102232 RepID=UPI0002ACA1B4|nr:hypothetical protein [Gloeocapsa sp. PCC 73106]ELR96820.1 hypothetical protein GLO73106DRAFT_00006190 [Gloeocapsa sp. PCC 73106]
MKRLIIGTIATVVLSSLSAVGFASVITVNPHILAQTPPSEETQPNDLVALAREGYFEPQGIPSGVLLSQAVKAGKVTAQSLIEAAISAGRVPSETKDDAAYVTAVENALNTLDTD